MSPPVKDLRIVRLKFEEKGDRSADRIRLGSHFVEDFIFDDHQAADIPINALRVIFNIVSIIGNDQFRPEDRPQQLSLFEEDFETENNIFASLKIKNSKISPSGSTKQVVQVYEYLAKFKMGWYRSLNSKGKEIKTFGGLISTPSYDRRGFTTFLISSYWLKKLLVIPQYNYVLYNLVYNIRNNKHIIFAIWLSKIPETGTMVKLSTFNRKFGLNYRSTKDFCFKFLKPIRSNLDRFNSISFNYRYKKDSIYIAAYSTGLTLHSRSNAAESSSRDENNFDRPPRVSRRLNYFRKRYGLTETETLQFCHQYENIPQTRALIENAFKAFIRNCRLKKIRSTEFQGRHFLIQIQEHMKQIYRTSKVGGLLPNGYPMII